MLNFLFNPKSIAVIGASNRPLTIGYRIIQNLKEFGYKGPIYPVHPKDPEINGLKAYPSVLNVPGAVDLAHIVVKNTMVPAIIEECGQKGVKFVIINTAGFKEIGGEGIALEKQIVELGKKYNLRIFGPNCQGIINTDENVRAYANFTFARPQPGYISILAQSGGVGEVVHQRLVDLGIGTRMYASNGNAADVTIPEILNYWATDEKTKVIIIHIESLANPSEFIKVARRVTRRKPVLGMKTGRTEMGARAVVSHTGSLMKADTAVEAIFDKCGIISFRSQEDLCQAAIAFVSQPVPAGPNVGIITNTGGPGIIATDECIEAGMNLPELSEETKQNLKTNLFPEASVSNPVDVLATAGPNEYAAAIESLLKDPNIDSLMVNFITPFFVDCQGVAREMARLSQNTKKPIVAVIMTDKKNNQPVLQMVKESGIPVYDLPETGAMALAALVKYGQYRQRPSETPPVFDDVNKITAQQIIKEVQQSRCEILSGEEVFHLLNAYKIPLVKSVFIKDADDIQTVAKKTGYPVVLKVDSPEVIHKTEQGGVVLGIETEQQLKKEYKIFQKKFSGKNAKFLVQPYLTGGQEIIIGAGAVPGLGHLIMFGLGGIFVEVLDDVAFRVAPLTEHEVRGMIQSVKGYLLLKGVRGKPGIDLNKLTGIILRLSQLVTEHPKIQEIDFNPVIVSESDARVVDARIKL